MDTDENAQGTLRREIEDLSSDLDDHDGEVISIGEILERASQRAFAPLLIVPALLNILPTGAIPGVTLATGIVITSVGVQLALGLPEDASRDEILRSATTIAESGEIVAALQERVARESADRSARLREEGLM